MYIYICIYIYRNRNRKDFNTNVIHAEPPFSCNYAKSRNGCYDI